VRPVRRRVLLATERDRVARVASKRKKRSAKPTRAPRPSNDEQISVLRAIWTELKALNARVDETNERLGKTNQRLDKTNKRLAKTNDRLDAIRSELAEQLDSEERDQDAEGSRMSRLERRVGLEPEE